MLIWHLFYKAQTLIFDTYFTKPKIIFWQKQLLYAQNPNANLILFCKAQIFFWQLFHKAQMLLWHIFTKFKYYFDICFTYTKIPHSWKI